MVKAAAHQQHAPSPGMRRRRARREPRGRRRQAGRLTLDRVFKRGVQVVGDFGENIRRPLVAVFVQ